MPIFSWSAVQSEVMERDIILLPAEQILAHAGGLKQAVVTRGNHITGIVSVNTALQRGLKECFTEVTFRDVAQRNFIIARGMRSCSTL